MNSYKAGSTGIIETVYLQNAGSSDCSGLTGLAYDSPSLTCYYKRSSDSAIVMVNLTAIAQFGQWVSGGFREIDSIGMPGCYEFHLPDEALVSGATDVTFFFKGASGLVPKPIKFELVRPR